MKKNEPMKKNDERFVVVDNYKINKKLEKQLKENFRSALIIDSGFAGGDPCITIPVSELMKMFDVVEITKKGVLSRLQHEAESPISLTEFIENSVNHLKQILFPAIVSEIVKEDKKPGGDVWKD